MKPKENKGNLASAATLKMYCSKLFASPIDRNWFHRLRPEKARSRSSASESWEAIATRVFEEIVTMLSSDAILACLAFGDKVFGLRNKITVKYTLVFRYPICTSEKNVFESYKWTGLDILVCVMMCFFPLMWISYKQRIPQVLNKKGDTNYLEFPFFPLWGLDAPARMSSCFKMASSSPSAARLQ